MYVVQVDGCDVLGRTAVHVAAAASQLDTLDLLLKVTPGGRVAGACCEVCCRRREGEAGGATWRPASLTVCGMLPYASVVWLSRNQHY